jgi:hypothetical protein
MKLTEENRSTRGKTCPSANFPTTNPTRTDPGSNPDHRGERPPEPWHGLAMRVMSDRYYTVSVLLKRYFRTYSAAPVVGPGLQ